MNIVKSSLGALTASAIVASTAFAQTTIINTDFSGSLPSNFATVSKNGSSAVNPTITGGVLALNGGNQNGSFTLISTDASSLFNLGAGNTVSGNFNITQTNDVTNSRFVFGVSDAHAGADLLSFTNGTIVVLHDQGAGLVFTAYAKSGGATINQTAFATLPQANFPTSISFSFNANSVSIVSNNFLGVANSGVSTNGGKGVGFTFVSSIASNDGLAFRMGAIPNGVISLNSEFTVDNLMVSSIPEPSSYAALVGLGALGLVATRRRQRSA